MSGLVEVSLQTAHVKRWRILLLISALAGPFPVLSQHPGQQDSSPVLDKNKSLSFSQSVIGKTPGNYQLITQDRKTVSLYDYRGKPLVVNFIYSSCYNTCPVMTTNLNGILKIAREAVGKDSFNVISVGFDAKVDTPERLRLFATQRSIDFRGWDFISADAATIDNITRDMGFVFAPSPNGFDHLAQTTILDANGTIYRQIYGESFATTALVEPLKELVFNRPSNGGTLNQWFEGIKLWCTVYDPSTNRYYFDYSIFYGIAISILCMGAVVVFVVRSWRENSVRSPADKV